MSRNNEFITNIIILTLSITHNYADFSSNISLGRFARSPDGGCALPDDFPNGKYSLTGNYVPGKEINDGVFVTVECNGNYIPHPKHYAACSDNKWDPIFPKCVLTCPAISSESVQIDCEIFGTKISCDKSVPEGTIAHMKCRPFYQDLTSVNPLSQCKAGSWDIPIIKCAAECGNEIPTGTPLIINGIKAENGKFPWHVAIYRKKSSETDFKNICGGTIISEKVVLSAAHCFIDDRTKKFTNASYMIGAGKYYSMFNSSMDVYRSQYITAKDIKTPKEYEGFETNYQNDIALIILEKAFKITQFVRPICVDWHNQFEDLQLVENNTGIVVGWGLTKEHTSPASELKQLNVPYRSRFTCLEVVPEEFKRFVTTDKFCGGFTNGSAVCSGDSGGGLFFYLPNRSKYYIRGIVSISPRNMGTCDSHQYAAYTKISHEVIKWISSIETENRIHYTSIRIKTRIGGGLSGCGNIEIIPNGNYEIIKYVPGEAPNGKGTILKIQCNGNYTAFPTAFTTCTENDWSPEIPKCIRNCPAIEAHNIDLYCDLGGFEKNCSEPMVEGTTVYMTCKRFFKPTTSVNVITSTCYGGFWDVPILKCEPECGNTYYLGPYPWHVAIYRKKSSETNFQHICAGSLISQKIVLTAAYCFTNFEDGLYLNASYHIAAGKPIKKSAEASIFKQYRDIINIEIPAEYHGKNINFQYDIALAIVDEPFEIIVNLKPICVDWNNQLENDEKAFGTGIVPYWELKDKNPDTLIGWKLRYRNSDSCYSDSSAPLKQFIKSDKFCAEIQNGTDICSEMSGGSFSLFWKKEKKYFIPGVVSIGPLMEAECRSQQYLIFTRLTKNILNWIRNVQSRHIVF